MSDTTADDDAVAEAGTFADTVADGDAVEDSFQEMGIDATGDGLADGSTVSAAVAFRVALEDAEAITDTQFRCRDSLDLQWYVYHYLYV